MIHPHGRGLLKIQKSVPSRNPSSTCGAIYKAKMEQSKQLEEKYEQACKEHSNKCEKMMIWAFSLWIAFVAIDNKQVLNILHSLNAFLAMTIAFVVAGLSYSYNTFYECFLRNYGNYAYYLFKRRENREPCHSEISHMKRLYLYFIIQASAVVCSYSFLLIAFLIKCRSLVEGNLREILFWLFAGLIGIIQFKFAWPLLKVLYYLLEELANQCILFLKRKTPPSDSDITEFKAP